MLIQIYAILYTLIAINIAQNSTQGCKSHSIYKQKSVTTLHRQLFTVFSNAGKQIGVCEIEHYTVEHRNLSYYGNSIWNKTFDLDAIRFVSNFCIYRLNLKIDKHITSSYYKYALI